MINLKSEEEIKKMRSAGKILAKTLQYLKEIAKPGITTKELDIEAEKIIRKANMLPGFKGYNGYPATICASINEEVVHTIPSNRKLQEGDILTIDTGVICDGYNTDAAITFPIGQVSKEINKFIETVKKALFKGIEQVKPGNKIGDISFAIQKLVESEGYSIIKKLTGHGVGRKLHEEPTVYNYGKAHKGPSLKPGMTIAIEPIIAMGSGEIKTLSDKWNIVTKDGRLAAQYEHTILVTPNGYEILTQID
ncbi:type I methionyl aminopeptidase [Candidatus Peregrinibacteria bacterium RIFOXYB2_FULL_32_7]|nr:MAG: type I methionyl aminopeptidase [Candidatus Peregrinibacteria bacterium RIFOXYB2_FULL_32_7]